ncbi:thioredoxin family protein [Candidatus Woesearchaeota archaeon]|nr:thioredoxin family protein [Candidatus Woesearchaeota archaeon]
MVLLHSDAHQLTSGSSAPHFSLKNIDGKTISLADFNGKALIVIFICNHCPYVKPKMQEIADLQNIYTSKGVAVICINPNDPTHYPEDNAEHMQQIAKTFGYRYYLIDETQEIARAYGATCTPDPFVFDQQHKLIYHGRINDAMNPPDKPTKHDLKEALDAMLAKRSVKDWFVPSMGCSIKWKE